MSASLVSFCSCLPTCLPSGLGCCVRLPGLVLLLSPVLSPNLSPVLLLSPNLSPIWAGVPWSRLSLVSCLVFQLISGLGCCVPPPWSCLALVSGLVSQCVFLSKSLVSSFCLSLVSGLVSGLGCCVCFPSLVLLLSPNLSPIWAGVLRPPPWSRLALVSGLVSQLVSGLALVSQLVSHLGWGPLVSSFSCLLSCLPTYLRSGMLCPASLVLSCSCLRSCLPVCLSVQVPGLVFLLSLVLSPNLSPVWDAVSASLVLSCSCLRSGDALVCGLGCCVRLPSLVLLLSTCLPSGLGCCALLSPVLSHNKSPVWDAVSASIVCSCLPTCLPSWLGCCVRPLGLVLFLSPVLSPNLSPVWGALSTLFSGLVSQQVSGLGCCVRLP